MTIYSIDLPLGGAGDPSIGIYGPIFIIIKIYNKRQIEAQHG